MRIPKGDTGRVIYFVAVDATDLKTRETSLSGITVEYSRNGSVPATCTSTVINHSTSGTNMEGVYSLTIDTANAVDLTGTNRSEELVLHITHVDMAPVTRTVEIYQPTLAEELETGVTIQQALKAMAAVLAGKASGGPISSAFKGIGTNTVRVTSTSDTSGDRSAVTLNL